MTGKARTGCEEGSAGQFLQVTQLRGSDGDLAWEDSRGRWSDRIYFKVLLTDLLMDWFGEVRKRQMTPSFEISSCVAMVLVIRYTDVS